VSGTFPTIIGANGLQPQLPANLRAQLVAIAVAESPGLTDNLPASMIEDMASTDVAAVSLCDSFRVDLVNSLTPYAANAFLLAQLGAIYGVPQQTADTTTSVFVVFSGSTSQAGFVIAQGFTVSDGTYQYTIQDGGVIESSGSSASLFALATISGSWVVPANTVTQIATGLPPNITLSVTNPLAGTPATSAPTEEAYRAQVLQAGMAISTGMLTSLRTALQLVSGVQARLISIVQQSNGYEIIVGGGDPYAVANAIFQEDFWIPGLVGSTIEVTNITNANPGVVTTNLNHGYTNGQVINISGVVGMTEVNNTPLTVTIVGSSGKQFSIGENTTGFTPYVSGGVVTPNFRNQTPQLIDFPNTYTIPFVIPPQQTVTMTVTWNTTSSSAVSQQAVSQLAAPALVSYVNSIFAGQPMNLLDMADAFRESISSLIPPSLITRLIFAVSINGVGTAPESGEQIIVGDPESYFYATTAGISINQG
jgi:hypothetical protein